MQLGLFATGSKIDVLDKLGRDMEKEAAKFHKLCAENQTFLGTKPNGEFIHTPTPIADTSSRPLLELVIKHVNEQLAHLKDDAECSVSFNITIHRDNP